MRSTGKHGRKTRPGLELRRRPPYRISIVIPRDVRKAPNLKAGMKIQVLKHADRIQLIPVGPVRELRGVLKGLDPTFARDEKDRA